MNRDIRRSAASGPGFPEMSSRTKGFLQKICYKTPASVDMTQYGFICDSKVTPVNLLFKPLREKLEKICGPSQQEKKKVRKKTAVVIKSPKRVEHVLRVNTNKIVKAQHRSPTPKIHPSPVPQRRVVSKRPIPPVPPPSDPDVPARAVRKSRVTFEEPCTTILKNYCNNFRW